MKSRLKLAIPDNHKANIFELAKQVREENAPPNRKRDKLKLFATQKMTEFGVLTPTSLKEEWEKCIKAAEEKNPETIYDFWRALAEAGKHVFKLQLEDGHDFNVTNQKPLSTAIYTALTQHLLTQLESEPSIYKCTQILSRTLIDVTALTGMTLIKPHL